MVSRTQAVELVTMVLIQDPHTQRVLVEDKVNVPWKAGHSFPGGHVEIGESAQQAAVREVREETGLVLDNLAFCGTCEWFSADRQRRKLGLLYRSQAFHGSVKAGPEGQLSWLPLNELTVENSAASLMTLLRVFNHEVGAVVSDEWHGDLRVDPVAR